MTLSILFSALMGAVTGYPLMKLELKSVQREKVQKILGLLSQGLAIAVCVMPFLLFTFPTALLVLFLMAAASLKKTIAAIIFAGCAGFLWGGVIGLVASIICPGTLLIPIVIVFSIFRNRSSPKQYTTLGIQDTAPTIEQERITTPEIQISLQKTAFYCSLLLILIESIPLDVSATQLMFRMENALPRLVQAGKDGTYGVNEALKSYGKNALPFEIEMIRHKLQNGWDDSGNAYYGGNYDVVTLTSAILEMGEAESLSQLGDNRKKVLRAVAVHYSKPADSIAIDELAKLKAITEIVSVLDANGVYQKATAALLQFQPNKTIPEIMEWQANHGQIYYEKGTTYNSRGEYDYCAEFAKYGEKAIPELIPYLGDDSRKVRLLAAQILQKIGSPAIPPLKNLLFSNNFLVVNQSAYVLGMLGEKSAAPILIKKIKQEEDDDGTLAEALSHISDERATQFFISDYQVWKNSFEQGKNLEEQNAINIYDESIARTKTQLAKSFLERAATQSKSLTNRKHLIQLLGIYFWKGKSKEKMGGWIEALESSSADQSQLAVSELRAMGDPVVLPFLVAADERAHKTGTSVKNCEIHAAIAAFSK